uniref:C-type lectin domain-containing protein n=1 Tax=Panagrellus redivivus TaxID=6233 RepID=A0A7E4W9X9_PANRE
MKLLFLACFVAAVAALPDNVSPNRLLFDLTNFVDHFPLKTDYVPCTDENFQYCQHQFNEALGYYGTWLDVALFTRAINLYYKQDVRGVIQLCNARTQLKHCFGTEYASCTSRNQFVRKGASIANAYQVSGIFNSLDFQCTGAAIQVTENWPCIYTVWHSDSYENARNACLSTFHSQPFNDQNAVCTAGETLAACLALQFSVYRPPCNNRDLIWFECERTVNFFQFDGNCPNIKCQLPKPSYAEHSGKGELYAAGRAMIHSKRSHRAKN